MEDRIEEGKIKGAIDSISLEKIEVIQEQMKSCKGIWRENRNWFLL